jgi:[ribosomal protein S18]-alanine N-acetyltransferase
MGRPLRGAAKPPPRISIRPARLTDIDALIAIENAVFRTDRLDRRALRHAIRSPTIICLVVVSSVGPLGYVTVQRRRGSAVARLTSIAIAPEAAGRGLGRRLLAAAEAAAAAAGDAVMRLEVRTDNRRARRLYEAAGYALIATIDDYYEDGAAALRYEAPLSARAQSGRRRGAAQ